MLRKILLVSCLILAVSCIKEIEMDIRGFERKLVVNCLFSPDKPFKFYFSYTTPPTHPFPTFGDSIHLLLYENNVKILDTKFLSDSLVTSIYPSFNSPYLLKVFVTGFDTVYASSSIPWPVRITDGTIQLIPAANSTSMMIIPFNFNYQISVTFSDPAGERNYYELFFGQPRVHDSEIKITDPVLINEGDISYSPTNYFFSDELFDGEKYTMVITSRGSGKAILRNISREYYLYRKYWIRHRYNIVGYDKEMGYLIYQGEPQAMYGNIINGYGIFAGYFENEPFIPRQIGDDDIIILF